MTHSHLETKIQLSIQHALAYLREVQRPDGFFESISREVESTVCIKHISPFISSLIMLGLAHLSDTPDKSGIVSAFLKPLLNQKSTYWTFNYWIRNSVEAKKTPLPDDLDCTGCAVAALQLLKSTSVTGDMMATIVRVLTEVEVKTGGPYRTWLVPKNAKSVWMDVDSAVNANIAFMLKCMDIRLPNLDLYFDSCIQKNEYSSPYYIGVMPVIYFIARSYEGRFRGHMVQFLRKYRMSNAFTPTPLHLALYISSLLRLGVSHTLLIQDIIRILSTQKNRHWAEEPFIIEKNGNPSRLAGSASLTTALCVEALHLYELSVHETDAATRKQKDQKIVEHFHNSVVVQAKLFFKDMPDDIRSQSTHLIDEIIRKDTAHQITTLPYIFRTMIHHTKPSVSDDLIVTLGVINLLGWTAYTIYDSFLDDEGQPVQLPCGNACLRYMTELLHSLFPKDKKLHEFYLRILNAIDASNVWELSHCRMDVRKKRISLINYRAPRYESYLTLSDRSFGHALGPITLLHVQGISVANSQNTHLQKFFLHYLIAKQLNDDAHDWENDMKNGHLSPVVNALFIAFAKKYPHLKESVLMSDCVTKCTEIFWYDVIEDVCKLIRSHIARASKSLQRVRCIINPQPFHVLLQKLDDAATRALQERQETIDFFQTYTKKKLLR